MQSSKNLPEAAFFSAEETVQLLSGNCPKKITKERLKEWLSYRKGTAKDGSARTEATKAELSQRVVSYIKNGWQNNFTEKWQHLAASKPVDQTATVNCDFPGSAQWVSLVDAKDDVPTFNIQNIVSYFIERKAKDNESNKDYKNVSSKAFGLFRHGHIQKLEIAREDDGKVHFRCDCLPEMKKNFKYNVKLSLCNNGEQKGEITFASCACPAGKGPRGSCKHIAALCYALEEFVRLKCTREFETCTSRLQTWNQPRKRKLDSQSVYEIDFSKKVYRREESRAKPLNDPRRPSERNNDTKNVNRELLDKIKTVKPNCGFFCLLSDERLDQNKNDIISPIKEHPVSLTEIFDRAKRIKRNLMVSDQERGNIALATKAQSNCQAWFEHRRVRITASQSKRALIKPSTSPTKAMREILHYNSHYQSNKMTQGLKDEKKIILLYENKVDCKVSETGFVISQSHPFLGASPDGTVDGGLVEIKRIFTDGLSLQEAVCKRGICKETPHGLVINRNHKFYYQVQQLMLCTKSSWTDLVLSDTVELIILHVRKNKSFLSQIVPRLENFYDTHISLELAYPRVFYGLPRLSKLIND
ncbi:hypothetical protein ACROYT_G030828 [Oculina patagonica]